MINCTVSKEFCVFTITQATILGYVISVFADQKNDIQ